MRILYTRIVLLLIVLVAGANVSNAQELGSRLKLMQSPPTNSLATKTPLKKEQFVELSHGLPRAQVIDLMGQPSLESVIGSLGRAKLTFKDDTVLLFVHDRLISIETPAPTRDTTDGRLAIYLDETLVVFPADLVMPQYDVLPVGDERLAINDSFYFKPTSHAADPLDLHFTPSTPQCLTDNCPGCENCAIACTGADGCGCGGGCDGQSCDDQCNDPCGIFAGLDNVNVIARVSSLFLYRDSPGFNLLVRPDTTDIQTTSIAHGMAPGIDAAILLNLTGQAFVEFAYLGLNDWSTSGSDTGLLSGSANGQTLSSTGSYEAELNDIQINFVHHRRGTNWSVLCGIRASRHEDSFTNQLVGTIGPGNPPTTNVNLNLAGDAENQLLGLQIGGSQWWNCGPVTINARIKAGVFHNEIEQSGPSYSGSIDLTSPNTSSFDFEDEQVSFLGDFDFSLQYAFSRLASARVGYRGMVLSNLAQSASQRGGASDASTLAYHGVFAGSEIRW